jgi:protein AroM
MSNEKRDNLVAMVTIGQSPRTDVTSDITDILGEEISIVECGALDNLDEEGILNLRPRNEGEVLVTRLRNGREVLVSHESIVSLVNQCISRIETEARVVVFLCTGEFKDVQSKKLIILPSDLLFRVVQSILPRGRAGVLIPSPRQTDAVRAKWARTGLDVVIKSLSPYQETESIRIREIAKEFSKVGVNLLVMDCIGYSRKLSRELKKLTGCPVILARTIVARLLKEIL